MKNLLLAFTLFICYQLSAQQKITIQVQGMSSATCQALKMNKDRISWYYPNGSKTIASNMNIEVMNVGMKSGDKGRFGLQADPDKDGQYSFNNSYDIKLRKLDSTKKVIIRIDVQTTLGNEVFAVVERDFSKISEPITLDGYLWRAGNDKIKPERRLCIEFSVFVNDPTLRKKITDNEGMLNYNIGDFQVFLRQSETEEWRTFPEPIQGKIGNGNSVGMNNLLPTWIDPSKKLYVRFCVKTPKGNFIWDEYIVSPNEYRKEHRASYYSGEAFNKDVPLH